MRGVSGNSGNWKPESYIFNNFRPDLLYYGGKNNLSGMGAVWELKPFSQKLGGQYSMSSVLQINHYVGELNGRKEGGLSWATGTTAMGTPKPFEGALNLSNGVYNFSYYIDFPEQGFIYYNAKLINQPKPNPAPVQDPVTLPAHRRDPLINVDPKTVGKGVGVGVGVMIILKLLENIGNRAIPIITPPIMPMDYNTEQSLKEQNTL